MKLKYYMRGVGVGVLFTAFMFVAVIIPNLKFENKIKTPSEVSAADEVQSQVAELVGNVGGSGSAAAESKEEMQAEPEEEKQAEAKPEPKSESMAGPEEKIESEPVNETMEKPVEGPVRETVEDPEEKPEEEPEEEPVEESEEEPVEEPVKEPSKESNPVDDTKNSTFSNRHVKAVRNDDEQIVELYIYSGCASEEVAEALCKVGLVRDTVEFDNYLMSAGYANTIHTGTYMLGFGSSYSSIGKKIAER